MRCLLQKESEIKSCARQLLKTINEVATNNHATVVGLDGDLGAGKTTLTRALASELGVTESVTSPTFVIQKSYPLTNHPQFGNLVHIDAYRLEGVDSLSFLDWERSVSDPHNLILVEWPGYIASFMPPHIFTVKIEHVDETSRRVSW